MKYSPLLLLAASFQPVCGQNLQSASISGSDIIKYVESPPGQLTVDSAAPLLTVLQGSAGAAGGNVELFASSDSGAFLSPLNGSPFALVAPTVLTATFDNAQVVNVRSLNGNDWFTVAAGGGYNISYGVDNLANQWFGDFLGAMVSQGTAFVPGFIAGNEQNLYNSFLANGGFAQLSDPNISYIHLAPGTVSVGLGGFLDAIPQIAPLIGSSEQDLRLLFPEGLQISELAIVDEVVVYSFSAVDSGVFLDDGVNSYSATYEQTMTAVPEPGYIGLIIVTAIIILRRRR